MDEPAKDAQDYCSTLVRRADEDRWLAARYAPRETRRRLIALSAMQCEIRRVPSAVSEPPLGEIRLQWWRDALAEIRAGRPARAHPVVEEIAATGLAAAAVAAHLDVAIDAASRPLYGEGFETLEDLRGWLANSDGAFDAAAARLLGGDQAVVDAATAAGAAFAMAREGRRLAPNLAMRIETAPAAFYREAAAALRAAPDACAPALLHLSLTPLYAATDDRPFPLRKRMKLFTAMALNDF